MTKRVDLFLDLCYYRIKLRKTKTNREGGNMVYKFPVYWTDKLKVNFLQRVILIHSYLYYEADNSIWSDRKYDEVAKQLTNIQKEHTTKWRKNNTQYGYCFYDFDGTTGFDLWDRLKQKDKQMIKGIAERIGKE